MDSGYSIMSIASYYNLLCMSKLSMNNSLEFIQFVCDKHNRGILLCYLQNMLLSLYVLIITRRVCTIGFQGFRKPPL